jgi:hypothetical protein
VEDPDVVVRIDGHAADLPGDPFVRQRLRPERIGLEDRDLACLRGQADLKIGLYDGENSGDDENSRNNAE